MRRSLLVIGILLAGSLVTFTQSQSPLPDQQGTGRIRGRVVAADTGIPLRGARITVGGGDAMPPRETNADADGRYEVDQLRSGGFWVNAAQTGYLSMVYGQRRPRLFEPGTTVALAMGQTVDRIDFALPRAGAIAVRLTDEAGQPLVAAQIEIQRFRYMPNGQRQLTTAPMEPRGPAARTDDRGEFRAFGLMPDHYVIRATVPTIGRAGATVQADRADGFAATYYPGTTNADDAQVVTIAANEERTVQFAMIPSRLARLTGTVFMSDGQPGAGMELWLGPGQDNRGISYGAGTVAANGTFTITGVPAGSYELQVRQNTRPSIEDLRAGKAASPLFGGVRGEFSSVPVTVRGEDVTNLRIVTGRGATISGRVVLEGRSALPATKDLRVFALPPGLAGSGGWAFVGSSIYDFPPDSSVGADGSFQIVGASGLVQLEVPGPGWMLKSVALDGRDVTDEPLDLTGATSLSGVVITLTDKLTSVSGQVRDQSDQLTHRYVVILLSREPAAASRSTYTARAGTDGRFEISRVRPGRYVATAIEWIEEGRQFAPEVQQVLWRGAHEFTVGEGQRVTLDLVVRPEL